ncbi:transcription regulator HTH, apses-type DNA-binding domain-containing protein, partial [Radiomyces spectabilis]|uniref:transcription regulator HTH, apses-type DNA-binding domain-containing protein n=1 Tax=Radiomyces spectabilis TaxID=64574 RepID=UPI00221E5B6F
MVWSSPGLSWNSSPPPLPPPTVTGVAGGALSRPGYASGTNGLSPFGPCSSSSVVHPPNMSSPIQRPKLSTTVWEDEGTLCYQVDAKSVCVARRKDNDMINGTKLLNVVGMSRGKRDGILKNEKGRVVVKVGAMHLKGVWITFARAKDLATKFKIVDILYPLFVEDPSVFL